MNRETNDFVLYALNVIWIKISSCDTNDCMTMPFKLCVECYGIAIKFTSFYGSGCHSSEVSSPELSSKATFTHLPFKK